MIVFELDISSLTQDRIQMENHAFSNLNRLKSSSKIDELIMIEMLILLASSFDRRVCINESIRVSHRSQNLLVSVFLYSDSESTLVTLVLQ